MKTGPSTRLAAAVCLLATGCLADPLLDLGYPDPILEECATMSYSATQLTSPQRVPVDILVVVDNSMSMQEEQANLAANFPILIRDLLSPPVDPGSGIPEHLPVKDLHIGVISQDMGTGGYAVETCPDPIDGDDGILLHEPNPSISGCDPEYPEYLSYESTDPDDEAIDKLATDFGCLATLGEHGCGFEQPLKAAIKALTIHADGANAGFLRPDSILTVLFLTDEEDGSIAAGWEEIFDTTRSDLGHLNLRCYHHPYMLEPIETYVDAFRALRPDPERLVVAIIGGVPQHPTCEGFGSQIPDCLEHPDMIERLDPVSMTRLIPSCVYSTGEAYPIPRFVRLAQELGSSALVRSICNRDFRPALEGLTIKLQEVVDCVTIYQNPPMERDPDNPCLCRTSCQLVEMLSDDRPCPPLKPCVRTRSGGCRTQRDGDLFRSLCTIPEVGTLTSRCDVACTDPDITHSPGTGLGWWYLGHGWRNEEGHRLAVPRFEYTDGMEPEEGSTLTIYCEECLGPPRLPHSTGGMIGTPCSPETCLPLLAPAGNPTDQCDWEFRKTYIAEAEECSGGACLVFRTDEHFGPHCSRTCGPSHGGRACPEGYACTAATMHEDMVPGCWCVKEELLVLEPGHPDRERLWQCR